MNKSIMIVGLPNAGKSTALRNLPMDKVAYLNCDLSDLTFPHKGINDIRVKDIRKLPNYIKKCASADKLEYVVLDTITSMLSMFERQMINTAGAKNTMKMWGAYSAFAGDTIHSLKALPQTTIVLSHLHHEYDEALISLH